MFKHRNLQRRNMILFIIITMFLASNGVSAAIPFAQWFSEHVFLTILLILCLA